jgi:hypothetical protein
MFCYALQFSQKPVTTKVIGRIAVYGMEGAMAPEEKYLFAQ